MTSATYVLIHGAGDSGWYWHLVDDELRERGHERAPLTVIELVLLNERCGRNLFDSVRFSRVAR